MESRSLTQPLLEADTGQGKDEAVLKEANEVKLKEANEVKLDIAEYTEIEDECEAGALFSKQDRLHKNVHSPVERAKHKCYIHKVHSGLRNASAKNYEPILLSIGPYHRGKAPLQDMEKHKFHFLQVLLERVKEKDITRFVEALKNEKGEPQALDCYEDTFQMNVDSFGERMVIDGFFMIELFRRNVKRSEYGEDERNDTLLDTRWMKPCLARDMLLLENQIPLFVLRKLFALTEERPDTDKEFVELALGFFDFNKERIPKIGMDRLDDIPHLLGLVYKALVPGTPEQPNNKREPCESITTAVTLENLGVMFHEAQDYEAFYDIRFSEGVLSIPRLVIDDNTESFFRNLIAYEQQSNHKHLHQVVDYLHVMECLIHSSKDVELLRQCGIIENGLWIDVKVSTMFNHLCTGVDFDPNKFFYNKMFDDVNKFCKDVPWKMRIAKLKKDYFGKPWSLLSSMVAVVLLVLTVAQLVFPIF